MKGQGFKGVCRSYAAVRKRAIYAYRGHIRLTNGIQKMGSMGWVEEILHHLRPHIVVTYESMILGTQGGASFPPSMVHGMVGG